MKLKCQRGHKENKNEYGKGEGEDEEDEEEEEEEDNEDEEIGKDLNNFEISIIKSEQSSFTPSQSDTELLEEEDEEEKNGEDEEKINNNQQNMQRICKIEQNRTYQPQQEYCEDNNNVYLQGQQQPTDQTEIYRELILRHLIADITSTCAKLGLPTELALWSADDSRRWVAEMCTQFQIQIPPPESFINLNGQRMLTLGVEEFQQRFPDGGDTLHAQLQLWKTAFESCGQQQQFIEINSHNRDWTNDNHLNSSTAAVHPGYNNVTVGSSTSPSSSSICSSSTSASQQFNQSNNSRRQLPSIRAYPQQQHYQAVHTYQGVHQQQYYSSQRTLAQGLFDIKF
uniref:PNT domain-containing protein n=1 Tax=Meloidogyne enterolobii TaxID=390850 RepID=A0A6V7V5X8_MELEN|nr:unnamed protein product [Meloidogyne enterolobii]CAD2198535.1 unnamed protein product [Meloidogyne enterolobii]CAD2198538.1 unnamed protein product [Meloidogyne enterolobii]